MAVVTPLILAYALFGEIRSLVSEPYEGYDAAVLGVWGWGMIAAILVLSVILSLLPWRGARHLDGPPATDDDPSDVFYEDQFDASGSPVRADAASATRTAGTGTRGNRTETTRNEG